MKLALRNYFNASAQNALRVKQRPDSAKLVVLHLRANGHCRKGQVSHGKVVGGHGGQRRVLVPIPERITAHRLVYKL